MNDTMSLLLASVVLATGGICLFMYKSSDDTSGDDDYNEDILFSENKEMEDDYYDDYDDDYDEPKKVKTKSNKTKRSRKTGGSKRRY